MNALFRVVPGDVRAHADGVARVEHAVGTRTPGEDALSLDAYGLVGQVFSGAAVSAMGAGALAVETLRRALTDTAAGLRECAAAYESADRRVADLFGGDDG